LFKVESKILHFFLPFLIILIYNFGCTPSEEILSNSGVRLRFSADTLLFDTILSGQVSTTKRLYIYNTSNKQIIIDNIELVGETSNYFSIIINGLQKNVFQNISLRGNDSLLVLATANIPTDTTKNNAFVLENTLKVENKNISQNIIINAFTLNAKYYKGDTFDINTTWDSTFARVIYKSIYVKPNVIFNIDKGTKIFVMKDQKMVIDGILNINGDTNARVVLQGNRFDKNFVNAPAQWYGICLSSLTSGVNIKHAIVKNAQIGIECNGTENNTEVNIQNTQFYNFSGNVLTLKNISKLYIYNTIIANAAGWLINAENINEVKFYNNTLVNGYTSLRKNDLMAYFNKINNRLSIINNIISANRNLAINTSELDIINTDVDNIILSKNIIDSRKITQTSDTSNFWYILPNLKDIGNYNFAPDTMSPAIDNGMKLTETEIDLYGKRRTEPWDIGAIEN
jgi:hypothetical protein